jgi:two-component system chemotaxis response regulator CheB
MVAIAASAGGLKAISEVLEALPLKFPLPITIVQHLDPRHPSLMAKILCRRTLLPVLEAREGIRFDPGVVYIAPPDRHLLVNTDETASLSRSEMVHFVRPSADLLFESAAATYKDRTLGVVMTGTGTDGSVGVRAIRKMGGTVIAQDQASSEFFGMPGAAIQTGCVDFILPLHAIAPALLDWALQEKHYEPR